MTFQEFLQARLNAREDNGSLRRLTSASNLIDFASNDYLGLSRSPELQAAIRQELMEQELSANGSTGSRLLAGNSPYTEELEEFLADIFCADACLLFNSGYSANLAVLSCIPQKGDTILLDEQSHASIKDGVRLSFAQHFSFRHNDMEDLEQKIRRASGSVFIVAESIYSMDGDTCPLAQLCAVADSYQATLILDEAHSTGVMGQGGNGMANGLGLAHRIPIRINTFGKAMGVHGACVTGSAKLRNYLINFARQFIYTTALPPHSLASIRCAFTYLSSHQELQTALSQRIAGFKINYKGETGSDSAIQPVIIPTNSHARAIAEQLQREGMDVRAILSPTVKKGTERLRICLHTFNTPDEITRLTNILNHAL